MTVDIRPAKTLTLGQLLNEFLTIFSATPLTGDKNRLATDPAMISSISVRAGP
jgi:hypothetical protein